MFKGLMKIPQKTAEAFLLVLSVLMLSAEEGAVLQFTHITLQTDCCTSCVTLRNTEQNLTNGKQASSLEIQSIFRLSL